MPPMSIQSLESANGRIEPRRVEMLRRGFRTLIGGDIVKQFFRVPALIFNRSVIHINPNSLIPTETSALLMVTQSKVFSPTTLTLAGGSSHTLACACMCLNLCPLASAVTTTTPNLSTATSSSHERKLPITLDDTNFSSSDCPLHEK